MARGLGASRCSICATNWPLDFAETCPECGEQLSRMGEAISIGYEDAIRRKSHADFERFYADRESKMVAELHHELDHGLIDLPDFQP